MVVAIMTTVTTMIRSLLILPWVDCRNVQTWAEEKVDEEVPHRLGEAGGGTARIAKIKKLFLKN